MTMSVCCCLAKARRVYAFTWPGLKWRRSRLEESSIRPSLASCPDNQAPETRQSQGFHVSTCRRRIPNPERLARADEQNELATLIHAGSLRNRRHQLNRPTRATSHLPSACVAHISRRLGV